MPSGETYTRKYRGTVVGVSEDYPDKSMVRVEIAPHNRPKLKKGMVGPATKSEVVPREAGQQFRVGDAVECVTTLRRIRRLSRRGNPRVTKAEEEAEGEEY
jgi:hypothetical protein